MTAGTVRIVLILFVSTSAILGYSAGEAYTGGSTCVTGTSVRVCVEWSQIRNPVPTADFDVLFADSLNPDIELIEGDLGWIVSSELVSTGAPANIGSLTTTDTNNFNVKIAKGTGSGAADVGSMVLTPAGDNFSSIASGSKIAGDLNGNLMLKADSAGNGGPGACRAFLNCLRRRCTGYSGRLA